MSAATFNTSASAAAGGMMTIRVEGQDRLLDSRGVQAEARRLNALVADADRHQVARRVALGAFLLQVRDRFAYGTWSVFLEAVEIHGHTARQSMAMAGELADAHGHLDTDRLWSLLNRWDERRYPSRAEWDASRVRMADVDRALGRRKDRTEPDDIRSTCNESVRVQPEHIGSSGNESVRATPEHFGSHGDQGIRVAEGSDAVVDEFADVQTGDVGGLDDLDGDDAEAAEVVSLDRRAGLTAAVTAPAVALKAEPARKAAASTKRDVPGQLTLDGLYASVRSAIGRASAALEARSLSPEQARRLAEAVDEILGGGA